MGADGKFPATQEMEQDAVTVDYSTSQVTPCSPFNATMLPTEKNWATLFVLPIVAFVAAGNVLVILAVKKDHKLRSSTNYFLTSLAVADLLVAITVMPPSLAMIVNDYKWPFSDVLCGIWQMLDVCFSTASILHLCMISLDRYLALAKPFRYSGRGRISKHPSSSGGWATDKHGNSRRVPSGLGGGSVKIPRRVAKRIIIVWAVSLGMALPMPILGYQNRDNIFCGQMCVINVPAFTVYGSLAAFFLPLVVMFVTYSLTIRTLQNQSKMVQCIMGKEGSSTHRGRPSTTSSIASKLSLKGTTSDSGKSIFGKRISSRVSGKHSSLPDIPAATGNGHHKRADSTVSGVSFKNSFAAGKIKTCARICCACFGSKEDELKELESGLMQSEYDERTRNTLQKSDSDNSESSSILNQPVGLGRSPMLARANITLSKVVSRLPHNRMSSRRISAVTDKSQAIASEQRASKVLGLIFTLFCVFWCPFFITNFVSGICELFKLKCDNTELMQSLMKWFVWVGYTSSGVNPCVYTLFSRQFRGTFRKLVSCRCGKIETTRFHRPFSRDGHGGFSTSSFHHESAEAFGATVSLRSVSDVPHRTLGESVIVRQHKRNQVTRSVDTVTLLDNREDKKCLTSEGDGPPRQPLRWRSTWHYMLDQREGAQGDSARAEKPQEGCRKGSKVTFHGELANSNFSRRRLFSDPNTFVLESVILQDSITEGEGDSRDIASARNRCSVTRSYSSTPRRRNQSPESDVRFVDFRRARFHCGSDSSLEQNDNNNNLNDVFERNSREHQSLSPSSSQETRDSYVTQVRYFPELLCTKRDAEKAKARHASSVSLSFTWRNEGDKTFPSRRESRENGRWRSSHNANSRATVESDKQNSQHKSPNLRNGDCGPVCNAGDF